MSAKMFLRAVLLILLWAVPALADAPGRKPNILFILADDLGYGDVGVLYQNARVNKPAFATPHLDQLAAAGMLMRQHYTSAPVCVPARASLLSGQTQGHCPVRDNQFDKALPEGLNLASMLKQAGYHTAIIGKYGLAGPPEKDFPAHPLRRGFDEFFGFLKHRDGHVYYHDAEHPLFDGFDNVTAKYENIYSTDLFTARAKKFIAERAAQPDQPFFLYLAYTAIHAELNIPGNAYPAGAGATGGMTWPPVPTPATRDKWFHPDYANKPWPEPMRRHATMARRLDDGVGDVIHLLRDLHLDDNTLVIFTSDNGPANEGGGDPRQFDSWGPFDGFKRDCWEGGVREPTIACWPGHITAGQVDDTPSAFWDWMPTFAEAAGQAPPAHSDGVSLMPTLLHRGVQRSRGYLYIEYFHNGKSATSADVFARKHQTARGQQQIVRIGDFVGVRTNILSPADPLRLYDVITDPHEDHNLAAEPSHRDLLARMTDLLVTARIPEPSAPRPYDNELLPPAKIAPKNVGHLHLAIFDGTWPWTPDFAALTPQTSKLSPGLALEAAPTNHFGASFTGYIEAKTSGAYTFTASTDGALHLWLHDCHLIDSESGGESGGEKGGQTQATVKLKAGWHPLRLFYRHDSGPIHFTLHYAGPDLPEQVIPPSALAAE